MSDATSASPLVRALEAIDALEAQLETVPRMQRPHEHAIILYRLGLAHAESPVRDRAGSLRKALAYYTAAASIFDARLDPVEHGRVLNAAGAAHRALGDHARAVILFSRAADLLDGRARDDERAAALNNVGLAQLDAGDLPHAVAAFDAAADLFDTGSAEGRRGRVATLHNLGLAHAAIGTPTGFDAALHDYDAALELLGGAGEAPYHEGLVHHSVGVAWMGRVALSDPRAPGRTDEIERAVSAFGASLTVFSPSSFPYQHALAKHNLGRARIMLGDATNLRRALAGFEDALAVLDPALHAAERAQLLASLQEVEQGLATSSPPPATRAENFALLLADCDAGERVALLRERLVRLLSLPGPPRDSALAELALAEARLGGDALRPIIEAELEALMDLPNPALEGALRARCLAGRHLEGVPDREAADRALDEAIGGALGGPQRVFVRDFLYSLGWERP